MASTITIKPTDGDYRNTSGSHNNGWDNDYQCGEKSTGRHFGLKFNISDFDDNATKSELSLYFKPDGGSVSAAKSYIKIAIGYTYGRTDEIEGPAVRENREVLKNELNNYKNFDITDVVEDALKNKGSHTSFWIWGQTTELSDTTKNQYLIVGPNNKTNAPYITQTIKSLADATVSYSPKSFIYNGKSQIPNVTVIYEGKELVKGVDYGVFAWAKNIFSDTLFLDSSVRAYENYRLMISSADGSEYNGSYTIDNAYSIYPCPLSSGSLVQSSFTPSSFDYTGAEQIPSYSIHFSKDGGPDADLVEGTDYSISFSPDTISAGKKSAIIQGLGNYTGSATISNVYEIKKISVTGITLSETEKTVYYNETTTQQLKATISPSNATNQEVEWESSNSSIVEVSSNGRLLVNGNSGTAIITCRSVDNPNVYATCKITVIVRVSSITLSPTSATINVGGTQTITATISPSGATDKTLVWSSSSTSVASVSNGVVTGKSAGTATITATSSDGRISASSIITVEAAEVALTGLAISPSSISLKVGETAQLEVIYTPSNTTDREVRWETDNNSVVNVSNGKITAVGAGSTFIRVYSYNNASISATCSVQVKENVVAPESITIKYNSSGVNSLMFSKNDTNKQLTADVYPTNASQNVVWESSNSNVVSVSSSGFLTFKSGGIATITCSTAEDATIKATCMIVVIEITIDPTFTEILEEETKEISFTINPTEYSNSTNTSFSKTGNFNAAINFSNSTITISNAKYSDSEDNFGSLFFTVSTLIIPFNNVIQVIQKNTNYNSYILVNGEWKPATAYIYDSGSWHKCSAVYVHNGSTWKKCSTT